MAEPRTRKGAAAIAGEHEGGTSKKPARARRTRARTVSPDGIAERAYAISLSESCGSPEENWLRAEQELLAGVAA
jgi:hypothetical protein